MYAGKKATTLSDEKTNQLMSLNANDLALVLAYSVDHVVTTSMSTFNCHTIMRGFGYSTDMVGAINNDTDIAQTMLIGMDKSHFPRDKSRYMIFSNEVEKFYCPIENGYINTNYFKRPGVQKPIFCLQLAETVGMLTTFFGMRNGKIISVLANEAGTKLLSFENVIVEKFVNSQLAISVALHNALNASACPDVRGWDLANLHGLSFANALYLAFVTKLAADESYVKIIAGLTAMIIKVDDGQSFFRVVGDAMAVNGPSMHFPSILAGARVNILAKEATLDQAHYALSLARSFRGENKADKGSITRVAYTGAFIDPNVAEVIYLGSNVMRFVEKEVKDIVVVADYGKMAGTLLQFLDVLAINDYQGTVVLPEANVLRNVLKVTAGPSDPVPRFSYGKASFKVVLTNNPASYLMKDSYRQESSFFPIKPLVFDLRYSSRSEYSRGELKRFETEAERVFSELYNEWGSWTNCSGVISRVKLFTNLVTEYDLQVFSGCDIHNLVCWTVFGREATCKWAYEITPGNFAEVCAASMVCNITRCMRTVYRHSPYVVLRKLGYMEPRLDYRGLGKMNVVTVAWQNVVITEAIEAGSLAVLKLFRESTVPIRATMLRDESVRNMLEERPASPVVASVPAKLGLQWKVDDDDSDLVNG